MGCVHDKQNSQPPLTPAERYQLAQGQNPRPQQPKEPPPEPMQRDIQPRASLGRRWAAWCKLITHFEDHYRYKCWFPRTRALIDWLLWTTFVRVPSFLRVVLGGQVDQWAYRDRNEQCDNCIHCVKLVEKRRGKHALLMFCGSCGCGQWALRVFGRIWATSELSWKNWFANHDCPHGVHDGSQAWKSLMPEVSDEDEEVDDMDGGAGDTGERIALGQSPEAVAELAAAEAASFGSAGGS